MTRRVRKQKKARYAPPQTADRAPSRRWIGWWAISCALLLTRAVLISNTPAGLVPAPVKSPIAPSWAWNVPLSQLLPAESLTWSPWLYAVVAATLITVAARFTARSLPIPLATLLVAVWSLTISPKDVVPASISLAAAMIFLSRFAHRRGTASLTIAGVTLAALGLSLEFGFLLAVGMAVLIASLLRGAQPGGSQRERLMTCIAIVVGLTLFSFLHRGFREALIRPISVWSLATPHRLLDATNLPFLTDAPWYVPAALVAVLTTGLWFSWPRPQTAPGTTWPAVLVAALLGLTSAFYLWLAGFVAILLAAAGRDPQQEQEDHESPSRWPAYAWGGALALLLANLVITWPSLSTLAITGSVPARRVDPSAWNVSGPVLLLDLDHSPDWQSTVLSKQFPLIISDRWDLYRDRYRDYAALCRDMGEGYIDRYIRSDGTWGGYVSLVRQWAPTLLVADSRDVQTIRRLSLSPHFRILGIDARRTIFSWEDAAEARPQGARAIQELLDLEWPSRGSNVINPQVIVAHQPSEWRQVGEVLCAMRFPYAAFRVMPQDRSPETERLRTACYLELAHRVYRQSGRLSLVDQFRAAARLRQHFEEGDWPTAVAHRFARGAAALGLSELATEILGETGASSNSATEPLHEGARSVLLPGIEAGSPEAVTRLTLARGEQPTGLEQFADLSEEQRRYYGVIANTHRQPPEETFAALRSLAELDDFPVHLQAEAWFSLGAIALEVGDATSAVAAFSECRRRDPTSPFGPLANFYLAQLRGRR